MSKKQEVQRRVLADISAQIQENEKAIGKGEESLERFPSKLMRIENVFGMISSLCVALYFLSDMLEMLAKSYKDLAFLQISKTTSTLLLIIGLVFGAISFILMMFIDKQKKD